MKVYFFILFTLLFACTNSKKYIPADILDKSIFQSSLKDIHLAQASYELNKKKGEEYANTQLKISFLHVYEKYGISKKSFEEALYYYSENAEELELMYIKILEQLNSEKTKLDQKETN